jgi:hypothetical protein
MPVFREGGTQNDKIPVKRLIMTYQILALDIDQAQKL